jgi:hypothetical protein
MNGEIEIEFALNGAAQTPNSVCYQGACSTVKILRANTPATRKTSAIQAVINSCSSSPGLAPADCLTVASLFIMRPPPM